MNDGKVVAVRGAVVDIAFASGMLPPINDALSLQMDNGGSVMAEVQAQLDGVPALCEAVPLSHAAENEARMRAMIAARTNVADTLDEQVALSRQSRREEITNEIIELSGGAAANVGL